MIEIRDNGDLHFIAANGDPIAKLQLDEPAVLVNVNPHGEDHPLNTRAEMLSAEDVDAISQWCVRSGATRRVPERQPPPPAPAPAKPRPRRLPAAELPDAILTYLKKHPDSSGSEIGAALNASQPTVSRAMKSVVNQLTVRQDGLSKRWRLKDEFPAGLPVGGAATI